MASHSEDVDGSASRRQLQILADALEASVRGGPEEDLLNGLLYCFGWRAVGDGRMLSPLLSERCGHGKADALGGDGSWSVSGESLFGPEKRIAWALVREHRWQWGAIRAEGDCAVMAPFGSYGDSPWAGYLGAGLLKGVPAPDPSPAALKRAAGDDRRSGPAASMRQGSAIAWALGAALPQGSEGGLG
jgi:hypothetical protein